MLFGSRSLSIRHFLFYFTNGVLVTFMVNAVKVLVGVLSVSEEFPKISVISLLLDL